MSTLIDRQAILKQAEKMRQSVKMIDDTRRASIIMSGVYLCEEAARNQPSAQPEIIRCKDCANWIQGYITDNDDFIPPKCGKYQQMVGHSSSDYCSLAERRTDAER